MEPAPIYTREQLIQRYGFSGLRVASWQPQTYAVPQQGRQAVAIHHALRRAPPPIFKYVIPQIPKLPEVTDDEDSEPEVALTPAVQGEAGQGHSTLNHSISTAAGANIAISAAEPALKGILMPSTPVPYEQTDPTIAVSTAPVAPAEPKPKRKSKSSSSAWSAWTKPSRPKKPSKLAVPSKAQAAATAAVIPPEAPMPPAVTAELDKPALLPETLDTLLPGAFPSENVAQHEAPMAIAEDAGGDSAIAQEVVDSVVDAPSQAQLADQVEIPSCHAGAVTLEDLLRTAADSETTNTTSDNDAPKPTAEDGKPDTNTDMHTSHDTQAIVEPIVADVVVSALTSDETTLLSDDAGAHTDPGDNIDSSTTAVAADTSSDAPASSTEAKSAESSSAAISAEELSLQSASSPLLGIGDGSDQPADVIADDESATASVGSEDKHVSFAPGTPEPKPTKRKKKNKDSSKVKRRPSVNFTDANAVVSEAPVELAVSAGSDSATTDAVPDAQIADGPPSTDVSPTDSVKRMDKARTRSASKSTSIFTTGALLGFASIAKTSKPSKEKKEKKKSAGKTLQSDDSAKDETVGLGLDIPSDPAVETSANETAEIAADTAASEVEEVVTVDEPVSKGPAAVLDGVQEVKEVADTQTIPTEATTNSTGSPIEEALETATEGHEPVPAQIEVAGITDEKSPIESMEAQLTNDETAAEALNDTAAEASEPKEPEGSVRSAIEESTENDPVDTSAVAEPRGMGVEVVQLSATTLEDAKNDEIDLQDNKPVIEPENSTIDILTADGEEISSPADSLMAAQDVKLELQSQEAGTSGASVAIENAVAVVDAAIADPAIEHEPVHATNDNDHGDATTPDNIIIEPISLQDTQGVDTSQAHAGAESDASKQVELDTDQCSPATTTDSAVLAENSIDDPAQLRKSLEQTAAPDEVAVDIASSTDPAAADAAEATTVEINDNQPASIVTSFEPSPLAVGDQVDIPSDLVVVPVPEAIEAVEQSLIDGADHDKVESPSDTLATGEESIIEDSSLDDSATITEGTTEELRPDSAADALSFIPDNDKLIADISKQKRSSELVADTSTTLNDEPQLLAPSLELKTVIVEPDLPVDDSQRVHVLVEPVESIRDPLAIPQESLPPPLLTSESAEAGNPIPTDYHTTIVSPPSPTASRSSRRQHDDGLERPRSSRRSDKAQMEHRPEARPLRAPDDHGQRRRRRESRTIDDLPKSALDPIHFDTADDEHRRIRREARRAARKAREAEEAARLAREAADAIAIRDAEIRRKRRESRIETPVTEEKARHSLRTIGLLAAFTSSQSSTKASSARTEKQESGKRRSRDGAGSRREHTGSREEYKDKRDGQRRSENEVTSGRRHAETSTRHKTAGEESHDTVRTRERKHRSERVQGEVGQRSQKTIEEPRSQGIADPTRQGLLSFLRR